MVSVALFLAATPEARHKQGSNVSQGTQDLKAQMDQAPIYMLFKNSSFRLH
jgi:hypothetical protein